MKEQNGKQNHIDSNGIKIQKRHITLLLWVLTTQVYGQTQQGYVKTQGRPNKPGVLLSGVTIRVRGTMNSVLSGADGQFSFLMPNKKDKADIMLENDTINMPCGENDVLLIQ